MTARRAHPVRISVLPTDLDRAISPRGHTVSATTSATPNASLLGRGLASPLGSLPSAPRTPPGARPRPPTPPAPTPAQAVPLPLPTTAPNARTITELGCHPVQPRTLGTRRHRNVPSRMRWAPPRAPATPDRTQRAHNDSREPPFALSPYRHFIARSQSKATNQSELGRVPVPNRGSGVN